MVELKKSLLVTLLCFVTLMASAFANPIDVKSVNIEEVNGDYIVLATLENTNVSSGVYEELSFEIEELGTSKNVGVLKIDSESEVVQYNLRDLTDSYDLLKKGTTYVLSASTSTSDVSEPFLFGSEKTTDGLDLILEHIEINDEEVTDSDVLQVLNGETLTVDLRFSALENFDDARIMVFIEGYEHSTLVESTPIFSVKEGKTYVKSVSVNLPVDMDSEKDYKLRITGANDLSGVTYKDFTLYVDTQRHRVDIIDLVMTPSSGVEAGQNIIANVRLKNRGQKEQDSVKVSVAVPTFNIKESSYVSNLDSNEVVTSDDMLLFIPESATAGQHEVLVTLSYDDGFTQSTETFNLNILSAMNVVEEENLIVNFDTNIDLASGEESTFEVVVANPNQESVPISIVSNDNVWADVSVSPSLVMVKGGESTVFTVTVNPKDSVSGEKSLSLLVKEGSQTISEIEVKTFVEEDSSESLNLVNVALAVLLIIAIIILLSLVIAISRRRNDRTDEDISTEEYY